MPHAGGAREGFTVGVEEEYQLISPVTGALRSRAREVLDLDWTSDIRPELQETTVEIGTRVCADSAGLDAELRRLRFQVGAGAAASGLQIVAAGVHPFSRWEGHERTRAERYRAIERRYGRIARDEHNFAMHVHVAVPPGLDRSALLNVVRWYVPHILALACSSPFFEGEDTGYSSYRMILWRRWPGTGVPPRLESEAEYRRLVGLLMATGAILDERGIYWSVRPHAVYPTIEFRISDACPRIEDAVAVAALSRTLVIAAAEGALTESPPPGFSESVGHALLLENEWRAAHKGLDATLLDPAAPSGTVPMRTGIRRLVSSLARLAEATGDQPALAHIETVLERGNGADRMRRVYRENGEFPCLMRWLAAETLLGTGLDRRRAQREECA